MAIAKATPIKGKTVNSTNYLSLIGKKIKYSQPLGHVPAGTPIRVLNAWSGNASNCYMMLEGLESLWPSGANLSYSAMTIHDQFSLDGLTEEKSLLLKKKKALEEEIEMVEGQQSYLVETGQEIATEKEMQVFQTLKVMEKDMNPIEKAKMLAKLFS
jgi:hypothetical protein